MRPTVHDSKLFLRANEDLLARARARARAEREGMTVSELVRHAIRRELRETA
jgi:hypothetical protein